MNCGDRRHASTEYHSGRKRGRVGAAIPVRSGIFLSRACPKGIRNDLKMISNHACVDSLGFSCGEVKPRVSEEKTRRDVMLDATGPTFLFCTRKRSRAMVFSLKTPACGRLKQDLQ